MVRVGAELGFNRVRLTPVNMHRSQIFFYILLAFILGVFAGSFLSIPKMAVLAITLVCAGLIAVFYRHNSRMLNISIALAAFLTLFFLAGILRYNAVNSRTRNLQKFAEAQENVIDPQNRHPIKVTVYGYVADEPQISGDKQRLIFLAKRLDVSPYLIELNEKVLITTQLYPHYQYGDQLKIYGQIKKPENFSDFEPVRSRPAEGAAMAASGRPVSSGFDYVAYLAKDGVQTTMFYPEITALPYLEVEPLSRAEKFKIEIFKKIFAVKNVFESSIVRSVSEPNAAFINGILLGSRSQIPQELKDDFARTGTSHILAISGYNITMIAMIISWFLLLFMRRPTAFWFSLAGVALFTILTGAQASVVRAAIMGAIVLLARREGRLNDPRNAIVLAGAAMILINPLILRYDIGFQLSFAATLGLIYLAPAIESYFQKLPKFFQLRETMIMTVSAQIFVLPLLLYYFKNFSVVSLPANLIILPTIPLAMILGFITGLAGLVVPFLGQVVGYFAWFLTTIELGVIKLFAKPDWAAVPIELNRLSVIVAYILLILFIHKLKKIRNGSGPGS